MTIKKVKSGYRVVSKSTGRNLGTFRTKHQAHVREGQIQAFKRRKHRGR